MSLGFWFFAFGCFAQISLAFPFGVVWILQPMGASKSVGAINRGGSIRDKILAAKKQQASMHEVGSHRSHHSSDAIAVEFKTKDQSTALRVDV